MSVLIDQKWGWIDGTQGMIVKLLDGLTDADLAFNPGGENLTLGGLFRELGEIEHAYIHSFKDWKQDFSYRNPEAGLDTSIAQLKAWLNKLNDEFKATLSAVPDADAKKIINRGTGFEVPADMQLDIYLQALLIFLGKVVIYLKAMSNPLSQTLRDFIG